MNHYFLLTIFFFTILLFFLVSSCSSCQYGKSRNKFFSLIGYSKNFVFNIIPVSRPENIAIEMEIIKHAN